MSTMTQNVSQNDLTPNTQSGNDDIGQLLDSAQIMRALKISRPTFHRMINKGELPVIKVSGRWKISREVLNNYMQGGAQ